MKHEAITSSVSERICNHMNQDHKDSILAYATFYGGIQSPLKARMQSINNEYMELLVDGEILRIKFDHILQDSSDAHQTLVSMLKQISL